MTDEERRIEEARAMGQAMQPTIGPNGMFLPNTDLKVTKEPHKVTENETKSLSKPATEALGQADAAAEAAKAARMSTIPVEGVAHELNMTPDELTSVGGLGGQINQGQMQDLINTRQTALEEQAAAKHQAELAAIAKKAEEARQKAILDQADRWKAVAEKASAAEMFDNRSIGTRILQGIAVGMEMYARIRSGVGGESQILKNIQAEIDRDAASRKAKLNAAIETAKAAGTRPEVIDKWAKQQNDDANQRKVAQLEWAKAQMGKLAALYPAKARELQMAQAEIDKGVAEKRAELLVAHTETSDKTQRFGQEVTRTEGTRPAGGGAEKKPTENEGKLGMFSNTIKGEVDTLRKNLDKIPGTMSKMQDNLTEMEGAEKNVKGPVSAKAVNFAREQGWVPRGAYTGMTDDEQKVGNAVDATNEMISRAFSGAAIGGTFSQGEEARLRRALSFSPDMSRPLAAKVLDRLERLGKVMEIVSEGVPLKEAMRQIAADQPVTLLQNKTPPATTESAPRVAPGGQTKAQKDYTEKTKREIAEDKTAKNKGVRISAADREALAWAAANPRDPRAEKIIKKIRGNVTRGE